MSPAQSSLGTTQGDTVKLNWILFKPYQNTQPLVIWIPRHLYDEPSQSCQPLFVQPLLKECKVATMAEDIKFWTTRKPLLIRDAAKKGWAASIDDFEAHFTQILFPTPFSDELVVEDGKLIHLVITVEGEGPVVEHSNVDLVPEMKEFKRYKKTLLTPGPSPSEAAKSTGYRKVQANPDQVIYDGRRVPGEPISTRAPPIQIFHPIFDDFFHSINDPDEQPTVKDLKDVQELMYFLSEVGRKQDGHNGLNEGVRSLLSTILGVDIHQEPNSDGTMADGVYVLNIRVGLRIVLMVLELKRELGKGGCDPTTQAGLSMKRSWIGTTREAIRDKCCCPTFLIAGGGPWLNVLGGVFTDKFIVQRLTEMRWVTLSSTEEDSRVYHNARVLIALRKCLNKLQKYYLGLDNVPPLIEGKSHPRFFPYPTSFVAEDGSLTHFRYVESLEHDAACVTYLAEILNEAGDPIKVVVKFVARYGREVHKFLARKGWAPTLRYCGPLPETKLFGILSAPARQAVPGLCLQSDLMHMVVMDYVDARPKTPPDARGQIQTFLTLLHCAGYVFGDLRKQNILFDADGRVKLIDFDWCGRYNLNIRDEQLPDGLQDKIDQNINSVQAEDGGSYAYYPLAMSTVDGMWATGMTPLAQIRPQHDWMMLDKLSW